MLEIVERAGARNLVEEIFKAVQEKQRQQEQRQMHQQQQVHLENKQLNTIWPLKYFFQVMNFISF